MAERTVPVSDVDTLPISGLPLLLAHLDALDSDPSTPIQPKLFDDLELQLTDANSPRILPTLLPRLTTLLFTITTQDPSPLLSLLTKLISPIPFQSVLPHATPDALLVALRSPLPGANILGLTILHKAAASTDDVKILADTMAHVVGEMVTVWVGTRDTSVAEKAARVIGELLEMDCPVVVPQAATAGVNGTTHLSTSARTQHLRRIETRGHGLLWRLLFQNPDNLTRIIANCSLKLPAAVTSALPPGFEPRPQWAITLSQGRLLRLLPRLVALDIHPLFSDHSPLFHSLNATSSNLLSWAALEMVDPSDMLMRLTLIDFFETLVSVSRVSTHQPPIKDQFVKSLVRLAMGKDESGELRRAMLSLPDRTIEEESEGLRAYLRDVVG